MSAPPPVWKHNPKFVDHDDPHVAYYSINGFGCKQYTHTPPPPGGYPADFGRTPEMVAHGLMPNHVFGGLVYRPESAAPAPGGRK